MSPKISVIRLPRQPIPPGRISGNNPKGKGYKPRINSDGSMELLSSIPSDGRKQRGVRMVSGSHSAVDTVLSLSDVDETSPPQKITTEKEDC